MKSRQNIVHVRITTTAAERIDAVVASKPVYASRQHFVRTAVEELLKKVEAREEEGKVAA